jgi:AbrB family looped-hinge helix DNA binding protein
MENPNGDGIMAIKIDKQGRMVLPKEIREQFGLEEVEVIPREDHIDLIPTKMDPAEVILREPCKSGDRSRAKLMFCRERVWR